MAQVNKARETDKKMWADRVVYSYSYKLFSWLKWVLYLWIRSKGVLPRESAQVTGRRRILVLEYRSLTDLAVVAHHCGALRGINKASFLKNHIYLYKRGWTTRRDTSLKALERLLDSGHDFDLVPVNVLWGRSSAHEQRSFFRAVFFDPTRGGVLPRIVNFFLNGRDVLCFFGSPIAPESILAGATDTDESKAVKLKNELDRVLRVQREKVLGPNRTSVDIIKRIILSSPKVHELIAAEAAKSKLNQSRVYERAGKYLDEIAAHYSPAVIRFFDRFLAKLWQRIYSGVEVISGDNLKDIAGDDVSIVYLPCHRSHMDYLLLGYVLYHLGFMPPHTAAGVNLNFWPIGGIFRKGGAFFIRRSFAGNRLYGEVFSQYVQYLLGSGFPISFYLEGGRSRTGYLLPPKTGLLSMLIHGSLGLKDKKVVLLPIYIGYDKLLEGNSYIKEIKGKSKSAESVSGVIKARKLLKGKFGKAYLSFGKPINLHDLIGDQAREQSGELQSRELSQTSGEIAEKVMEKINAVAVMTPVSLLSTILLGCPKGAILESGLEKIAGILTDFTRFTEPVSHLPNQLDENTQNMIDLVEQLNYVSRFKHSGGDVLYVSGDQKLLLTYSRNNVLHIFIVPALVASFFMYNAEPVDRATLRSGCLEIIQFFHQELFIPWSDKELRLLIEGSINMFLKHGLLTEEDRGLARVDYLSTEHTYLNIIANFADQKLEQLAVFTALLFRYSKVGIVQIHDFEEECRLMTKKLSILNSIDDTKTFDHGTARRYLDILEQKGYIGREDGRIVINPSLNKLADRAFSLLPTDMRKSITNSVIQVESC